MTETMDGSATDRVAVLERYEVLDRPPRRELLALVDLAARVSGVPMATINLITDTHQHQVATVGFERSICSYEESMCTRVLEDGRPIVSYDAREDERFSANPFVTGALGNVRFYASHPLTNPEGVMIGTLCVFDDRPRRLETEQAGMLATLASRVMDVLELELRGRQLESALDELQVAHDALARSNERLAAFAGQVSHDLKNPLTALELSLGLMEEEVEDLGEVAAPLAHLVGRAARGAVRMEAMIGDLLTFAQLGGDPQLTDVPLDEVVEEALHDLDGSLPDEGVQVGPLPTVLGDATQLRVVIQNLLSNAAKFAEPGRPPEVAITGHEVPGGWRVEVTDRGRGIAEQDRERVFEPMVRVDKSVAGSGIGLATCRRILSAHGGRIGVDARPGGGTVAWFELPGRV